MNQFEYRIQCAIFDHHQTAYPFVKFVYVPNASKDASTGYFNKKMGLCPGAHDIHCYWNRTAIDAKPAYIRVGIFEVKSPDGKLTTQQNRYASEMHQIGAYTGWGYSVAAYHKALKSWGLVPVHNAIKEPDLRTDEEKKRDAFDLYSPR